MAHNGTNPAKGKEGKGRTMKPWKKKALLITGVVLVVIQFVRPARTNVPGDPLAGFPNLRQSHPDVAAIFVRSCSDCHSEDTRWPWYSNVAPVSWLVASDVHDGRHHFNMTTFSSYTPRRQRQKLGEICDEVKEGDMPALQYRIIHWKSWLSDSDVETLCKWTREASVVVPAATPAHPSAKPVVAAPATGTAAKEQ